MQGRIDRGALRCALTISSIAAAVGHPARAQEPTPPAPTTPAAVSNAELLRRLEQMEQENRALLRRVQQLESRVPAGGRARPAASGAAGGAPPVEGVAPARGAQGTMGRGTEDAVRGLTRPGGAGESDVSARREAGVGAQGTGGRTFLREYDLRPAKTPAKVVFSEGLEFSSGDDEFKLSFHDLTQAEYRGFPAGDRGLLQNQFFIPRQRWYFTGQATRSVEFYTVINRGYGSLDLLDAFITLNLPEALTDRGTSAGGEQGNPKGAQGTEGRVTADRGRGTDSRARFRVGRMKTPYLYEYYSIAEGDLIAPERSIYAGNLAGNRQDGAMMLGELFKERVGYATGIFNGPRRSFNDFNSRKDLFAYLNIRPFLRSESDFLEPLKYLNVGGSAYGGREKNPTQPSIFTTANDQTSAGNNAVVESLSPTFLAFNNNVTELGHHAQWAAHIAYYYKSLMVLAEYGGGYQDYSTNKLTSTRLPFSGYEVTATYFLTGERLTRRVNVVRPIRRFGYHDGKFGLGAIEVYARYSELDMGRQVFTAGLADPNLWANRAEAVDVGFNWYWNFYTKIYFDWQHAVYNQPVTRGNGRFMDTTNLFWIRFQLFF